MEKVIILNATELGYQIIAALGERGIKSIVLYDRDKDEIGRYSKYVLESIKVPDFIEQPHHLLQFLMDKKNEWEGTLIIPTRDFGVEFLSEHKKELSQHYIVSVPDMDTIQTIVNKKLLYEYAQKIGVPVPRVFNLTTLEDIYIVKDRLEFPCLLKPGRGHVFYRKLDMKMVQVDNFQELITQYQSLTRHFEQDDINLMISEKIPGPDSQHMIQFVSYLDASGDLLASMTSRKLRQDPPIYGYGRIVKSEKNRDVNEISLSLLRKLNYHGFSEIEWKYDTRDRTYKLIEINPRFVFYLRLCTYCGINFPYIHYLDVVRHQKTKCNSYKENIYWIHLYKDILHTLFNHRMEHISFREYLLPYFSQHTFAVLNLRDPKPFYHQWKQHLGNMLKKLFSRN